MFRIEIRSLSATIWRAPTFMETQAFNEAIQIADRMARACRKTASASCGATRNWVIQITGESGEIFYRAPVGWA